MALEKVKVYRMQYDNKSFGDCGDGNDGYLGEYYVIQYTRLDAWICDFLGINVETNEVVYVITTEICGFMGGMHSQVIPLKNIVYNGDPLTGETIQFEED